MPKIIEGMVILEDKGKTFVYQRVCEHCGWESSPIPATKGSGMTSSFKCENWKCGEQNKLTVIW